MKIYLDRSLCNDSLPTCERRMARLIRFPLGEDRPCITAIEEDGRPELTLVMKSDGREATIVLDRDDQEVAGVEGFSAFLPWTPAFYRDRNIQPHSQCCSSQRDRGSSPFFVVNRILG